MKTVNPARGKGPRTPFFLPLVTLLLTGLCLPVSSPATQFDLWLEASQDDLGIDDYYGELGITLDNGVVLQLGAGSTDYNDNGTSVTPGTTVIGISAPLDQSFVPALRLETWEAEGVMKTATLRVDLSLNLDNWTLRATPLFKNIELAVYPLIGPPRTVDTEGQGLEAAVTWYGLEDWSFGASAGGYSYEKDLTLLNTRLAARVFSEQALTSSSALLDSWWNLSLDRYTSWGSLGASYGVTTSAVTLTDADNLAVNVNWDLTPTLALYVELGETRPEGGGSNAYTRAALNVRW